eukprot:Rhum_TRINITY_DN17026_c0_g1::Rhum_TRINITY_DN17026_c0_g1_i1::g.165090::m.165090
MRRRLHPAARRRLPRVRRALGVTHGSPVPRGHTRRLAGGGNSGCGAGRCYGGRRGGRRLAAAAPDAEAVASRLPRKEARVVQRQLSRVAGQRRVHPHCPDHRRPALLLRVHDVGEPSRAAWRAVARVWQRGVGVDGGAPRSGRRAAALPAAAAAAGAGSPCGPRVAQRRRRGGACGRAGGGAAVVHHVRHAPSPARRALPRVRRVRRGVRPPLPGHRQLRGAAHVSLLRGVPVVHGPPDVVGVLLDRPRPDGEVAGIPACAAGAGPTRERRRHVSRAGRADCALRLRGVHRAVRVGVRDVLLHADLLESDGAGEPPRPLRVGVEPLGQGLPDELVHPRPRRHTRLPRHTRASCCPQQRSRRALPGHCARGDPRVRESGGDADASFPE